MDKRLGIMQNLLCALVRFYQFAISPLKSPCCRFEPSCSEYAIQAISQHGVIRGLGLATWRILRCHPFYRGNLYDPVPPPKPRH